MKTSQSKSIIFTNFFTIFGCIGVLILSVVFNFYTQITYSQNSENFRVGERLTYNISFENIDNAAFLEVSTVSKGKLDGRDSVELNSKLKSVDLLSAAFYMLDEERTTFAEVESGLPLYVKKVSSASILPETKVFNFLQTPTSNFDFLTVLHKIRYSNGVGTFLIQENGKNYNLTIQSTGIESITTSTGDYETTKIKVQSPYLVEQGITDFIINISSDIQKLPVAFEFVTEKGEFRGEIASIQMLNQEAIQEITPTPTPLPTATPKPVPTPEPYVDNEPLIDRLPFDLGETLEFKISKQGINAGKVVLKVEERKQVLGKDSLLLRAIVSDQGELPIPIYEANNGITSQVDPVSLMPSLTELKFSHSLSAYNQTIKFDQEKGTVVANGQQSVDIPVGTHSILSLAYAIRSFNLRPSIDKDNPVNDTRVAVFLDDQAYVFTLQPSKSEIINLKGEKISAQLITIRTGNPSIDKFDIKLWLGVDFNRLPLKLTAGDYQADLVTAVNIRPTR